MVRAVQLRAAGHAIGVKVFVRQISTALRLAPEQAIITSESCNFGLDCSKADLICIGLSDCWVLGAANCFGTLIDVNA